MLRRPPTTRVRERKGEGETEIRRGNIGKVNESGRKREEEIGRMRENGSSLRYESEVGDQGREKG